ncbi:MAG: hypothetical protein MJE63_03045 [Proteobacteria bacterium]|nr:hypothetical protein [Pseudomonadota bacterium]
MKLLTLIDKRTGGRLRDAATQNHIFFLRGGFARPVFNGFYSLLVPGWRIARKIESIIREELDNIG